MKKLVPILLAAQFILCSSGAVFAGGDPAYSLSFGGDLCLEVGQEVEVVLFINNAPNEVNAFLLDVTYNTEVLTFTTVMDRGELVEDFSMIMSNEYSPGIVRAGGVKAPGAMPENSSGSFLIFHFNVIAEGDCGLCITYLADDLEYWSTVGNSCACETPPTVDLTDPGAGMVLYGGGTGDALAVTGQASPADINGDGLADLVLASHLATALGRSEAGAVYVYFGDSALGDVRDVAGVEGDAPDVVISGAEAGDRITEGGALRIADLNGDGLGDLVIGSPSASPSGRTGAGAVWVVYGSRSLGASIDLAGGANVVIQGAADGDGISQDGCLASGDVNGDGTADLVIGAPSADPGARADAGAVYVLYGSGSLPGTVDLGAGGANATLMGSAAGTGLAAGGALALDDMNGDARDDIAFGAQSEAPFGAGKAYVVFGSDSLASQIDMGAGGANITLEGTQDGDSLTGQGALGLGDVNGDGFADLLAGAPGADPGGREGAGEVYVVFGGTAVSGTFNIASGDTDARIQGNQAGSGLAGQGGLFACDLNGDGVQDLVMEASLDDPDGRADAGSIFVVLGGAVLTGTVDLNADGQDLWIKGGTAGDRIGDNGAVQFGDPDGNGIQDLVFGSGVVSPGGLNLAGQAYILYGSTSLGGEVDLSAGGEDMTIPGLSAGDALASPPVGPIPGGSLALGDCNGDGTDDILMSASGADGPSEGRDGAGEGYLVFGQSPYETATRKHMDHSGDSKARNYGTIRVEIDFESGENLSTTSARLNRSKNGLTLDDSDKVADVYWEISTDRTGFTAGLAFHYLESEIAGLVENGLALYRSETRDGPWTKVEATLDADTNTLTVTDLIEEFGFFILQQEDEADPECFVGALRSSI